LFSHVRLLFLLLLLRPSHDANSACARNRTPISTTSIDSERKKEKRKTENRIFFFSLDTIGRTQHIATRKTTLILYAKEKEKRRERRKRATAATTLPSILTKELGWRVGVPCQWRWQNGSSRKNTKYMLQYARVGVRCAFCYCHPLFSKLMTTTARILEKRNEREIDWYIPSVPPIIIIIIIDNNIFTVLRKA
jgi:hypothetical protein